MVNVVASGRLRVGLDEGRLVGRLALDGAQVEKTLWKGIHVEANPCPWALIVPFEDHPLRAAIEALFDIQSQTPGWDVPPF